MLDRTIAPGFSKNFSFDLPQPEIIAANDHLNFIFLKGLQQDVFKLEIVFEAGKWQEHLPGLSHFTANLLEKGSSQKTSSQIAESLDYFGAQIEIVPGYDHTSVSLYGLKKHIREIFTVFKEVVFDPTFPQDEFDLQKEIFLQNLKVNNEKNSFVASKLLRKNIFGPTHPYGSFIEESGVLNLSVGLLKEFYQKHFSPQEVYLIGNFNSAEVKWLTQEFKSYSNSNLPTTEFSAKAQMQVENVPKADSVQSSIRLGKRIINRNHPDYFPLLLINHILGGYFGSRLMKNIREEKGLTYGIYSSVSPFKNDCMFSIGADVGKEKLDEAITEIKKEINFLCHDLISNEELTIAKNHFLGSLQLDVANPFSAFDKIKGIRLNQLPPDYYKTLFTSVTEAKSNDLRSIAQKYFGTADFFEISVG